MRSIFSLRKVGLAIWSSVFMLFVVTGCGSNEEKTIPVEGTVTLDDKPVEKGSIAFHPDTSKGNKALQAASGDIENGKFKLNYRGKDGAPAGAYKVTVVVTVPSDPKDEYSVPRSLINSSFGIPEATTLSAEVKEGGGPYTFKVTK